MTDRRTALITGASAGIGAAFARAYGARDHDLILTARRADRLEVLAQALRAEHGVTVTVLPADLADPAAPKALMDAIEAWGLTVDVLINNAGYGVNSTYLEADWPTHADFLHVMVTAVAELTRRVLPGMHSRGYGRIIQVSSVAGLLPGAIGHTLYGASKSFLITFSECLFWEHEGTGVHVSALCPGFTYSEFHDVNGTRGDVSRLPKWMWMTADAVVARSIAAVEAGRSPICVPGAVNNFIVGLGKVLPHSVLMGLSRSRSRSRR